MFKEVFRRAVFSSSTICFLAEPTTRGTPKLGQNQKSCFTLIELGAWKAP